MALKSMTQIQVRIDTKTKRDAMAVLEGLGLDLSTAIKMFCRQIQMRGTLPLEIRDINGFTPQKAEELRETMREAESPQNKKTYRSGRALVRDILG